MPADGRSKWNVSSAGGPVTDGGRPVPLAVASKRSWASRLSGQASLLVALVVFTILPRCAAKKVRAMDLLPYLKTSPPTGQVAVQLCNVFKVVEKPYYILFGSCWVCALMQQVIDATRYYEERLEELGLIQKCYVGIQLVTLILETLDIFWRMDWFDGASVWDMYNLYVYVFVHSSVFVRSVMMSMIVWDWYSVKVLQRPVFGKDFDGQGWADWERASMLVIILQFGSSVFIMAVVTVTHLVPALLIYYWVFLLATAFIIKSRSWLSLISIDPGAPLGRGLVMASNSFVAIAGLQTLITGMIRVYAGQMAKFGYLSPVQDDIASRHLYTWYECHLSQGWGAFHDQDFLNLFVR